jgi:hypothetical protein
MKTNVIFSLIFAAAIGLAAGGEVTLSLKQIEGLKFSGSITNSTDRQVYVAPIYLVQQFYAQPNCSDCATGWVASRPMAIDEAKDFIPLASGASFKFTVIGSPHLPWRVTCVAVTNSISVTDKNAKPQGRIVIQSAEMPERLPSH